MRFAAFLLVFIHHAMERDPGASTLAQAFLAPGHGLRTYLLACFANACGSGLCLFFTLSAYLITDLLLKEREVSGAISIQRFYIRRALRIWPLYFFGVAIGMALALTHHSRVEEMQFVWFLLFVGNVYAAVHGLQPNAMMPLWSISIEEQFYLLWPWAMRFLSKRWLVVSALMFIAGANATLFILGQNHADTDTTVWANTFVQFQMFAVGILLAVLGKQRPKSNSIAGCCLVFTGSALWLAASVFFHFKQLGPYRYAANGQSLMLGYAMVAAGCAAFLQGAAIIGPKHIPPSVAALGKISYGLYVYHLLARSLATKVVQTMGISHVHHLEDAVTILLQFLLTVIAASLSYKWFESYFLRLKRRFEVLHTRSV